MFAYCNNNSTNYVDPLGTDCVLDRRTELASGGGFVIPIIPIEWLEQIFALQHDASKDIQIENVDWDGGDKNHILRGTKGKHIPGWMKFGFDPQNPNGWESAILIIQEVIEKGNKSAPIALLDGSWIVQYSKQYADIGVEVVVKIWSSPNGFTQKLSDAIPYIIE